MRPTLLLNNLQTCFKINSMFRLLLTVFLLQFCAPVFADDANDARAFFEKYVAAANSYAADLPGYYISNAKIIRVVEKPDGSKETIVFPAERYFKQLRMMRNAARLKGYKNTYTNQTVTPEGSDYKISATRTTKGDNFSVPSYFIIGKDSGGAWKIKTEYMHTRNQSFLKHKD